MSVPPAGERITVLYVAGSGRSGTTIINTILGQMPGVFAAGELRYAWSRGVDADHRCGCGEPFSRCPVWQDVMARMAPIDRPEAAALAARLLARLRVLATPAIVARHTLGRRAVPAHPDDDRIVALYRALHEHTGGQIVVDSSKLPLYGLLLQGRDEIDLRILHVVRDPRATAFSWRRSKPTQDTVTGSVMPTMPVWKAASLWSLWNVVTAWCWRDDRPGVVRFRYEDFVAEPRRFMEAVCDELDLPREALPFVSSTEVTLAPTHSVAGNPNRHTTGSVPIRADLEWHSSMSLRDRFLVTLCGLPGILRFAYPWNGRPARPVAPSTSEGVS